MPYIGERNCIAYEPGMVEFDCVWQTLSASMDQYCVMFGIEYAVGSGDRRYYRPADAERIKERFGDRLEEAVKHPRSTRP